MHTVFMYKIKKWVGKEALGYLTKKIFNTYKLHGLCFAVISTFKKMWYYV